MAAIFTSKFSAEPVRVVFFDVAGTLLRTAEPVGVTYARVARRHGFALCAEEAEVAFRGAFGTLERPDYAKEDAERAWWRELVTKVFGVDPGDACFAELFGFYEKPDAWTVYPGVVEGLKKLAASKRLGVISNFDERLLPLLEGLGLTRFFECVTVSGEVGAAKPAPRIFAVACARMGVLPEACLMVGDDEERDLAGAEAAGMRWVRVGKEAAIPWDWLASL